jgi:pimeloyl-ACP methyl ester carboxylesterase
MTDRRRTIMSGYQTFRRLILTAALGVCLVSGGAAPAAGAWFIEGTTANGALYEFAVPDEWNGVLVVYAHGIINPYLPVALPTTADRFDEFRAALLEEGIAVAYSSFSENGFALKDGAMRTHQLRGLFTSKVGLPSRVYITGHSLGGMIAISLAEKYPAQYDAALPMCGFLNGTELQVEYLTNIRILFDALFDGVLPGHAFDVPMDVALNPMPWLGEVQSALIGGLSSGKTQQLFEYAKIPGRDLAEKLTSTIHGIGYNLMYTNDLLGRTHGHIPFDNTETDYGPPGEGDPIDIAVHRFVSSPDAVNFVRKYVTPTGNLQIPVITLHTSRDSLVPVINQALYGATVAKNGASSLLRQRTVDRFGHCSFELPEMMQAFGELRAWVEEGTVPAP